MTENNADVLHRNYNSAKTPTCPDLGPLKRQISSQIWSWVYIAQAVSSSPTPPDSGQALHSILPGCRGCLALPSEQTSTKVPTGSWPKLMRYPATRHQIHILQGTQYRKITNLVLWRSITNETVISGEHSAFGLTLLSAPRRVLFYKYFISYLKTSNIFLKDPEQAHRKCLVFIVIISALQIRRISARKCRPPPLPV